MFKKQHLYHCKKYIYLTLLPFQALVLCQSKIDIKNGIIIACHQFCFGLMLQLSLYSNKTNTHLSPTYYVLKYLIVVTVTTSPIPTKQPETLTCLTISKKLGKCSFNIMEMVPGLCQQVEYGPWAMSTIGNDPWPYSTSWKWFLVYVNN